MEWEDDIVSVRLWKQETMQIGYWDYLLPRPIWIPMSSSMMWNATILPHNFGHHSMLMKIDEDQQLLINSLTSLW